jgi:uncharacterized protein (TIGR02597 family)
MAAGVAVAQPTTATTTPVGYTSVACLPDSDTVVGLPLRISPSAAGALSSAPTVAGGQATLTVAGATFGPFGGTHYVKFKSGASEGKFFAVVSNTDTQLVVDLNGAVVTAAAADTIEVLKFWTLAELFNPGTSTSDATTTPNAIVASVSTAPAGRRTEVVIPDLAGVGSNLAPNKNFYVHAGIWKQVGQGATSFNDYQLWPDTHFIIRNPSAVTAATKYVTTGQVDTHKIVFDLASNASVPQDNYIALTRPVDITLNQLNLGGSSAFVSSTSSSPAGRRDEVLVYNNSVPGLNKSPSANYYYLNGAWRKVGSAATLDVGGDIIPAGSGIIVRKFQVAGGATATWTNSPSY